MEIVQAGGLPFRGQGREKDLSEKLKTKSWEVFGVRSRNKTF